MKTKIVYTLVSSPSDFYLEQALLSVYSLRLHNPRAIVELAVDQFTAMTLVDKREEIKRYITNLIEIVVPEELNKVQRSRYLKTNLRKFIKGDYLFIDCDTVVCKPLDDIDNMSADVAMVADLNRDLLLDDPNTIHKCEKAGFYNMKGKPYYNSGVIYAKDTPKAHNLYKDWYNYWLRSKDNGINNDQPALNAANVANGEIIRELDAIWNCQYKYDGYKYLTSAYIHHYFGWGIDEFYHYHHNYIFERIKENGYVDDLVDNTIKHPYTILYSAITIHPDRAYEFYFSELLFIYMNRPKLMRIIFKIAHFIETLCYGK